MHVITDLALSRLIAQQRAMDVTANNIANADTPGFKSEQVLFTQWLSPQRGAGTLDGDRTLSYAQDRATFRDDAPGQLRQTGNPLDLAIAGAGYFTVRTPQGTRLTRGGSFTLATDGTIVDANGNALLDRTGQTLQIAQGDTDIAVAGDGTVSARSGTIGKIAVVTAKNPASLQALGSGLMDTGSGTVPAKGAKLVQGAIEDSNVQPILQITSMMNELREFQYTTQFVQAEGDRELSAIDKILKRS